MIIHGQKEREKATVLTNILENISRAGGALVDELTDNTFFIDEPPNILHLFENKSLKIIVYVANILFFSCTLYIGFIMGGFLVCWLPFFIWMPLVHLMVKPVVNKRIQGFIKYCVFP